jgi:gliding motility-associated-like protein
LKTISVKKIVAVTFLLWSIWSFGQECPALLSPVDGAVNVAVDTTIQWEDVVGVTGYIISIGTTPGGGEIVNEQQNGSDTTFVPPLGLPESTLIYVRITLFFFDQDNIICESQSFTTENVTTSPECSLLTNPLNGETGVNVAVNLSWEYASRATGYRLSLGTSPGSADILDNFDVGNILSYNPPVNFPPDTIIYVALYPYNENGIAVACQEESFTTASLGDPPDCTQLITPANGAINVSLSPILEWAPVANAIGYRVYIGKTPFINDVLDGAVFTSTSTLVLNFESNNTYFVRIVPFNEAGQAQSCGQESFSTILGCGPFYDPDTGELISFYPETELPDVVGICENQLPTRITSPDLADGYRWFQLLMNGDEELLSEEIFVDIFEEGTYRYELYNLITQDNTTIECSFSKEFQVISSSIAAIEEVLVSQIGFSFNLEIIAFGLGEYEYAIDGETYQDSNFFTGLIEGSYTVFVRDKNGCGVAERFVRLSYPATGFPLYFSPNGDGINDYWQYIPPILNPLRIEKIYIYDRYGKVIANFGINSEGWDGRYHNRPMPSDGYWYKAVTIDKKTITGYFSLVR